MQYIKGTRIEDLTGQTFNKLKVLQLDHLELSKQQKSKNGKTQVAYFLCECQCENKTLKVVMSHYLKNGKVKSCGCLKITNGISKRKLNKYVFKDDYVIGYSYNDNSPFYIDLDDYTGVKEYYWFHEDVGYFSSPSRTNHRIKVRLHSLVMKPFRDEENKDRDVDHIETLNKWDNRKSNLRFATKTENMRNSKLSKNNKSGFIGVYWSKKDLSWYSQIKLPEKTLHLGYTKTKEQAIINRLNAELKYFGKDFAPQRHLFEKYGIKQSLDTPQ